MIGPQCNNQEMRGSEQVSGQLHQRKETTGIRYIKSTEERTEFRGSEAPYLYKVVNERRTTPAIV